ncbi:hypothetical protein BGX29_000767 [Mortierella sp. GBA35]|nr:hypothetical protein BGX29_000767 [Mortierella sp. GBA35]
MGHLLLNIQTSTLLLKAKHAFSLKNRKSSSSSSSSSTLSSPSTSPPSSSSPTELNSSQFFSTAINNNSNTNSLIATSNSTTGLTSVVAHQTKPAKVKRSSRFKVKTFASFRDRSSSPPLTSSSTSSTGPVSAGSTAASSSLSPSSSSWGAAGTTATTGVARTGSSSSTTTTTRTASASANAVKATTTNMTVTPPQPSAPVFSVNPYSSSWSPSTVSVLKSPLRTGSSSKANSSLDLMQCSLYSPAPNLILQPSPAIDLAPNYATGARSSTSRALLRRGTSETSSVVDYRIPVCGPQGK